MREKVGGERKRESEREIGIEVIYNEL